MLGTLDMRGILENSQDLACLRGYLQQLVGEPFLHARFSYGDELMLHFGEPRTARSRKLANLVQGSYIVAARASSWYFKTSNGPKVSVVMSSSPAIAPDGFVALTGEKIEGSHLAPAGTRVIAADVLELRPSDAAGFTCSLLLADGSSLLVVPEMELADDADQETEEVADWEVFMTPHERYLRVGPGPKWSYLCSRHTQQD